MFMNITAHPFHLTERQLKLSRSPSVQDQSTDTVIGPDLPRT